VVVVFLDHLPTPSVVLEDLLVRHSGQELVRPTGVDAYDMGRFT
jgi:hypothetical protein